MNIHWITNILLPEATSLLIGQKNFKSSGGWLLGAAKGLLEQPDILLAIASISNFNDLILIPLQCRNMLSKR